MAKRFPTLVPNPPHPEDIAAHHRDLEAALRVYYRGEATTRPLQSPDKLLGVYELRLRELRLQSSLALLTTLEAAFRIDFLERVRRRERDELSRDFREHYKQRGHRVRLRDDIFHLWAKHVPGLRRDLHILREAMLYRDWLAHGRYWERRRGRSFNYAELYEVTQAVYDQFPFIR